MFTRASLIIANPPTNFVPQDDKHASCRSDEVPAKLCNETAGGCGLAGDVLRAHSDKPNTYHALQLRILMAEGQDSSFLRMTTMINVMGSSIPYGH